MFTDDQGGFFNQTAYGTSYGGQKPKFEEKKKTWMFIPVTIKMINDASPRPDDVFEIDGAPMNEIIIVGRII